MPQERDTQGLISIIDERIALALRDASMRGHRHDGLDEPAVLMSELEFEKDAYGRLPFNYKYAAETSTDTLSTEATLISATLTPHKSSNVLIMAWCQVNTESALAARTVTLRLKRGSTTLATAVIRLVVGDVLISHTPCFFAVESPESFAAMQYDLTGETSAGSPTATNKAIMAIELPYFRDTTS